MSIDKKLTYKNIKGQKHILAYITPGEAKKLEKLGGQKIMTKEGIPAYPPGNDAPGESTGSSGNSGNSGGGRGGSGGGSGDNNSPGTNNDGSNANSSGDGGSTNREKGLMSRGLGPKGTTGNTNNVSDDGGVDRSAVSQFSTFGRNTMNQNLQGPSTFSNITGGIKDYVLGGGLIGMGIRGLGSLFGPSVPSTGNVGPAGIKTDGTYGTIGDAINAGGRNEGYNDYGDGDGLGIMTANILPYQLPGEEVPVSQEEKDFIQRFKVKDQFRKAKGLERLIQDKAIAEMISKLYT